MELAERSDRLLAAVIDRVVYLPCVLLAVILMPGVLNRGGRAGDLGPIVFALLICPAIIFCVQVWMLTTTGQSIGKRFLKLKIVRVKDLTNGGFVTNVLLRVLALWALGLVPFVGTVAMLVNPFLIFRDDRRCLHDHIAGTCVIKA